MMASKPEGPYTDAHENPLVDSYDPSTMIDDDNSPSIIFGEHTCKFARLKESMTELDEEPKDITINRTTHFPHTDKNSLHKHNGTYHLGCSGCNATLRNICGPCETIGLEGEA